MTRTLENLELDGGCFVFDFINTVSTRKSEPAFEYLKDYQDLLDWSAKVGLIRPRKIHSLRELFSKKKRLASSAFNEAVDAREKLYKLFSAIGVGAAPDPRLLDFFNEKMSFIFTQLEMRIGKTGATLEFRKDALSLEEPLVQIMKNAFDILQHRDFSRIKECPRCGWIFLDTSRNGKRRWCDMSVCGSREKSLEYYYRNIKSS